MFDEGQVAFEPMDYSDYRTYMPYPWRVKKFSGFDWECLPFPSGREGANVSAIDTLMVAMSSKCSHKDLAWEFMFYLSSDEEYQKQAALKLPAVSVLPSVMKDKEVIEELQRDIPGTSSFVRTFWIRSCVRDAVCGRHRITNRSCRAQMQRSVSFAIISRILKMSSSASNKALIRS